MDVFFTGDVLKNPLEPKYRLLKKYKEPSMYCSLALHHTHPATTQSISNQQKVQRNATLDFSAPTKQARTANKSSPSSSKKNHLQVSVITNTVLEFLPEDGYVYFATVNTVFEKVWVDSKRVKKTVPVFDGMTVDQLVESHETGLPKVPSTRIYNSMVQIGRLDLLVK